MKYFHTLILLCCLSFNNFFAQQVFEGGNVAVDNRYHTLGGMYVWRGELFKGDTIDRALITAFYDCKFMTDTSMYPSLNSGDIIYINTIAHRIKPVERNPIVAFKLNGFSTTYL